MGASWSCPIGTARPANRLMSFTAWHASDLAHALRRHRQDLGGRLALRKQDFSYLIGATSGDAASASMFVEIFDTDRNGLVDAFEVLCALALLSATSLSQKADFIHSLFDFGGAGGLGLGELVMLLRTAAVVSRKIDTARGVGGVKSSLPSDEGLEAKVAAAFEVCRKAMDDELSKDEFDMYVSTDQDVTGFLQYWTGALAQIPLPPGEYWVDKDFPAGPLALCSSGGTQLAGMPPPSQVRWLRPHELPEADEVELFLDGCPGEGGLVRGVLADGWIINALAILTSKPPHIRSLFVPTGQEDRGRFCVQLYKEGRWQFFYIDSLLPCGAFGELIFGRSARGHELWIPLVEKAMAKAHGCYENLSNGSIEYALRDLTGGHVETAAWRAALIPNGKTSSTAQDTQTDEKLEVVALGDDGVDIGPIEPARWLFDTIRRQLEEGRAVGVGYFFWPVREETKSMSLYGRGDSVMCGLLQRHMYPVIQAFERGNDCLLMLRNPWSKGIFNGDWSESSSEWRRRPDLAQELLGATQAHCFWMSASDLTRAFNTITAVAVPLPCGSSVPGVGGNETVYVRENFFARAESAWQQDPESAGGTETGAAFDVEVVKNETARVDVPVSSEGSNNSGPISCLGWERAPQCNLLVATSSAKSSKSAVSKTSTSSSSTSGPGPALPVVITITVPDCRFHGSSYRSEEVGQWKRGIGFALVVRRGVTNTSAPAMLRILPEDIEHLSSPLQPSHEVTCLLRLHAGLYTIIPICTPPLTPKPGKGKIWITSMILATPYVASIGGGSVTLTLCPPPDTGGIGTGKEAIAVAAEGGSPWGPTVLLRDAWYREDEDLEAVAAEAAAATADRIWIAALYAEIERQKLEEMIALRQQRQAGVPLAT